MVCTAVCSYFIVTRDRLMHKDHFPPRSPVNHAYAWTLYCMLGDVGRSMLKYSAILSCHTVKPECGTLLYALNMDATLITALLLSLL